MKSRNYASLYRFSISWAFLAISARISRGALSRTAPPEAITDLSIHCLEYEDISIEDPGAECAIANLSVTFREEVIILMENLSLSELSVFVGNSTENSAGVA